MAREQRSLGTHSTNLQRTKFLEKSNSLLQRIEGWRNVQRFYVPGISVLLAEMEEAHRGASALPQDTPLLLPSGLNGRVTCSTKLKEYEWHLRLAQANDALDELCNHLRVCTHMWKEKREKVRGIMAHTRAQEALGRQGDRVAASAQKYRVAWRALRHLADKLDKLEWEASVPVLKDEDIRGLSEDANRVSEGQRHLSWIWTNITAVHQAEKDPGLNDGAIHSHFCFKSLN